MLFCTIEYPESCRYHKKRNEESPPWKVQNTPLVEVFPEYRLLLLFCLMPFLPSWYPQKAISSCPGRDPLGYRMEPHTPAHRWKAVGANEGCFRLQDHECPACLHWQWHPGATRPHCWQLGGIASPVFQTKHSWRCYQKLLARRARSCHAIMGKKVQRPTLSMCSWLPRVVAEETAIQVALEARALQILMDLQLEESLSWSVCRFGRRTRASRPWREGESLGTYVADLHFYAHRGYATFDAAAQEALVLVCGLQPKQLQEQIYLHAPKTLAAALTEAERAEHVLGSDERGGQVCFLRSL